MELPEFFALHPKAALAFSGGVDSAYLLYAALKCGADVRPYYVKSQFQPQFEYEDAKRLCRDLGAEMRVLDLDILSDESITANPENRCYFCKKRIMAAIRAAARRDGYELIIDGTNASDSGSDRPGMRALSEGEVLSPLRICGLSKGEIRARSKAAGLFTHDKPAYACLATRIPAGEEISAAKLEAVEKSEDFLFSLGFTDFRVRLRDGGALLQFTAEQQPRAAACFDEIERGLTTQFAVIKIDPNAREKSK